MLINKICPLDGAVVGTKFGIEIEMEGKGLPLDSPGMLIKKDGSLRGESAEYVFEKPYNLEESLATLVSFKARLKECETRVNYSFRTSTHTHMNVSDMDHVHVLNIIYIYLLLEDAFIQYAGEGRKGNRFCLRLRDAEGILDAISMAFGKDPRYVRMLEMGKLKYASINLAAIPNYGSLEFRALAGTHEVEKIKPWLEALSNMRELAVLFENPYAIYKKYIEEGNQDDLLLAVFREHLPLFAYPDVKKDMAMNASLSISIPFELTAKAGGDQVEVPKVENVRRAAKLDFANYLAQPMPAAMRNVVFNPVPLQNFDDILEEELRLPDYDNNEENDDGE